MENDGPGRHRRATGRMLLLSPEHPDPEGNGGEVRIFRILLGLARLGWDVAVVAPGAPEKVARCAPLVDAGVRVISAPRPASRVHEVARAVAAQPRRGFGLLTRSWLSWQAQIYLHRVGPLIERVLAEPWDAVVVEHDWAIDWARFVPEGTPVAMMFQNLTDDLLRGQAATATSVVARVRATRDARLLETEVRRAGARLSRAFACSSGDAVKLRQRLGVVTDVVPNGTDVTLLAGVGSGDRVADRILFTGTMSYPPNAEAAAWFVERVLPIVRLQRPGVTFRIVGGGAGPDVVRLGDIAGVEVAGRVPSLVPYLASASVVVAPLLTGGGTKLKVLEALAAGRPLVATPVGAAGIDVDDGAHLRVADGPECFARAVVALLADPAAAEQMGERGRTAVSDVYDWGAVARTLDRALTDWLDA